MTKKIFLYSFMLGAAVLLMCSLIFFGFQYMWTMEEAFEALEGETSYAAVGLQNSGIGFLKSLNSINRITWIDRDGTVLYDSKYPDLEKNQKEFEEVSSALQNGRGREIRKSSSGGVQSIYYALLCEDGTVLRLSKPMSAVRYALRAVTPVFWGIILVLLISGAVSYRIASAIAMPVNRLNLDDLSQADVYPELYPLIERLKEQRTTIEREAEERESLR